MRRRFVEDLNLAAWNLMPGSEDPYYKGPRLYIDVALRLDTDLGVTRDESTASDAHGYVAGLSPVNLEAMVANVNIVGLWNNALDIRFGRQIRIDTLGFFAFDGLETRLHLPMGIGMDVFAGYEVRGGHALGFDTLELDGTDSGGRHDMEPGLYPDRTEPVARLAVGTELSISPWRWLDAGVNFRAVGLTGPIADERLGGRVSIGAEPVHGEARAVWCPVVGDMCEVDAEVAARIFKPVTVYLEYHLFRPVFEADSIFNVFDFARQNDVGGRVQVRLGKNFSSAAWGFARLSDGSAGLGGEQDDSLVSGAGGGLGANYRTSVFELSARGSAVKEWGEQQVGAEVGIGRGFFRGERLWLRARGSVWHIDDQFSERLSGNVAGYVLSTRFRLSHRAHVLGEFEQYAGGGRDARYRLLALLQLDLWR